MSLDLGSGVRRGLFQSNRRSNPYQLNHILFGGSLVRKKTQSRKDKEDERLGENVGVLKKKFDAMYGSSLTGGAFSTEHKTRQIRPTNKNLDLVLGGSWWKDALGVAGTIAPFVLA